MNKHTPGPWDVLNSKKEEWYGRPLDYWTVTAKDRDLWICASPEWDPEHDEESTANARLIAAAPELLEALQKIVAAADGEGWSQLDATLANARAAIAKARGEA